MPSSRAPRRLLTTVTAVSALALAGFALYGNGDWAIAADAEVNPVLAWNACLLEGKPAALGAEQPGITPGSRLSYRPRIDTDASGDRALTGWVFFGYVTRDGNGVQFTCSTDVSGGSVQWDTTPVTSPR